MSMPQRQHPENTLRQECIKLENQLDRYQKLMKQLNMDLQFVQVRQNLNGIESQRIRSQISKDEEFVKYKIGKKSPLLKIQKNELKTLEAERIELEKLAKHINETQASFQQTFLIDLIKQVDKVATLSITTLDGKKIALEVRSEARFNNLKRRTEQLASSLINEKKLIESKLETTERELEETMSEESSINGYRRAYGNNIQAGCLELIQRAEKKLGEKNADTKKIQREISILHHDLKDIKNLTSKYGKLTIENWYELQRQQERTRASLYNQLRDYINRNMPSEEVLKDFTDKANIAKQAIRIIVESEIEIPTNTINPLRGLPREPTQKEKLEEKKYQELKKELEAYQPPHAEEKPANPNPHKWNSTPSSTAKLGMFGSGNNEEPKPLPSSEITVTKRR